MWCSFVEGCSRLLVPRQSDGGRWTRPGAVHLTLRMCPATVVEKQRYQDEHF